MSDFGYSSSNQNMFWHMTAGHNCTNYVAYRLVQNGLPNLRPWVGTGNAYNWGLANPSITDQTPTAGAVAWYDAFAQPMGAYGHVAYVERVVSDDEIIISEDNWNGNFHWRRITRDSYWPSGFIHFGAASTGSDSTIDGASPEGEMDRAWTPTAGRVSVTGWAFDADAATQPLAMSVSIGGKIGAVGAETHRIGTANWKNTEVADAYPGVGDHQGMYATVTTRKRGTQKAYLYASNAAGTPGKRVLVGTKTVTIANPDPKGKVTLVSSPRSKKLHLRGWALDPNAKTKPSSVRAYIGGPAGKGHRVDLGVASLSSRAAAAAAPGAGKRHGFDRTVRTKWTGKRTVYVYALNLSGTPGTKSLLVKKTITIRK